MKYPMTAQMVAGIKLKKKHMSASALFLLHDALAPCIRCLHLFIAVIISNMDVPINTINPLKISQIILTISASRK
jgi:hypothetical protein